MMNRKALFWPLAAVLLTACEKGLVDGVADVAPTGQVMNSVLQVRTRSGGSAGGEATVAYPVTVYVFSGEECRAVQTIGDEACYLAGVPFHEEGMSWQETCELLSLLRDIGCRSVIITSCRLDGQPAVCGYNHFNGEYFHLEYEEIPGLFHGTGDIFSAVLIGQLLKDMPLKTATRKAMDTVYKMISRYRDTGDKLRGIPVERCLDLL